MIPLFTKPGEAEITDTPLQSIRDIANKIIGYEQCKRGESDISLWATEIINLTNEVGKMMILSDSLYRKGDNK